MAKIQLENVTRKYPPGSAGVTELNLRVADGEIVALVGPSGCGKTTTLRLIAGLETPTAGQVHVGEHDVTSWPPHRRNLAMAFQNPALYPHLNVRYNLEFGLRMRRIEPAIRAERIREIAAALNLQDMLQRMPGELSGGERQRVAVGRALVQRPNAFLFDEPFSNLDAHLRASMRMELTQWCRKQGVAVLYVTHDLEEAIAVADRIVVLHAGRVQQHGTPLALYSKPVSAFVGWYIGAHGQPNE